MVIKEKDEDIDKAIQKAKKEGKCAVPEFADIKKMKIQIDQQNKQHGLQIGSMVFIKVLTIQRTQCKLEEVLILRSCYLEILVELSEKFDRMIGYIP